MNKKIINITTACIIFSIFQIQTAPERNTALGIGLFAGTAILARNITASKQREKQQDEAVIDTQKIFRGHAARQQADALKQANIQQKEAATKIQNKLRTIPAKNQLRQLRTEQAKKIKDEELQISIHQRYHQQTQSDIQAQHRLRELRRQSSERFMMTEEENQTKNFIQQTAAHEASILENQRQADLTRFNLAQPSAAMIQDEQNSSLTRSLVGGTSTGPTVQNLIPEQEALQSPHKKQVGSFPSFSPELLELTPFGTTIYKKHRHSNHKIPSFILNEKTVEIPYSAEKASSSTEEFNTIIKKASFKPKDIPLSSKSITLIYVPGSHNESIHGDRKQAPLAFENEITVFAKKVALAENAQVNILYYHWNGSIDENERIKAGKTLAETLSKTDSSQIITLSHSHGGNVVLHAAQALKTSKKTIDHAVLFGCPFQDRQVNIHENNIGSILNIHSDGDFTAASGSYIGTADIRSIVQPNALTTTTSLLKATNNAINVQIKIDGNDPTHRNTALLGLRNLDKIMQCVRTEYPKSQNIIANIDKQKVTACLDPYFYHPHATAEMQTQSDINAQDFQALYKKPIDTKMSMNAKYENEVGDHIKIKTEITAENLIGEGKISKAAGYFADIIPNYAVWSAAMLLHDPLDKIISKELNFIQNEPELSEQTIKLAKISTILFEKHPELDPQTIKFKLQHHKEYKKLEENLISQQYKSEYIKQKTRATPNPNWSEEEKNKLDAAIPIYNSLNDEVFLGFLSGYEKSQKPISDKFMQEVLSGYETLDQQTQQALLSSLPLTTEKTVKKFLDKSSQKKNWYPGKIAGQIANTGVDYLSSRTTQKNDPSSNSPKGITTNISGDNTSTSHKNPAATAEYKNEKEDYDF